jgi:hypothetical protein
MSRAETIAALPPDVVADLVMYDLADGGIAQQRPSGWACPCMTSKAEPLEGYTVLPQMGDVALNAGDERRLGFVFPGDGGAEKIREAGTFYLWEGGFLSLGRRLRWRGAYRGLRSA